LLSRSRPGGTTISAHSEILLVAQSPTLIEAFQEATANRHHRPVVARDSRHALEIAANRSFCLLVVDLASSDVSGWHLLAQLKNRRLLSGIPLIGVAPSWDRPQWLDRSPVEEWVEEPATLERALTRCSCKDEAGARAFAAQTSGSVQE
jgi:DNA-binding NtrC family response regulator